MARGNHGTEGFHLCDRDHCQVYAGTDREHPASTAAVNATSGVMIYYNDAPIEAVFHSSSGGATDDSEKVWGGTVPYLRGVYELNETTARQWQRTFSTDDLTFMANQRNFNIGSVTGIAVTQRGRTGRVLELTVFGTLGNRALTRGEVTTFFSPIGGSLDSRNFEITGGETRVEPTLVSVLSAHGQTLTELHFLTELPIVSVATANGIALVNTMFTAYLPPAEGTSVFTLIGSGWGHGVGMSQHGARGLAELGWSFDAILMYYYTGTVVK
jgi:stage II sporulation protein D